MVDLNKVRKAEKFNVNAECVDKYTGTDGYMYIVFKTEFGIKVALPVPVQLYGTISVGDKGELYYGIKKNINIFGSWTPKE